MKKALTLIVKRGALRRFDALKRKTQGMPVAVIWDRRESDRRQRPSTRAEDKRQVERRQRLPFTWDVAEFVLVEESEAEDRR